MRVQKIIISLRHIKLNRRYQRAKSVIKTNKTFSLILPLNRYKCILFAPCKWLFFYIIPGTNYPKFSSDFSFSAQKHVRTGDFFVHEIKMSMFSRLKFQYMDNYRQIEELFCPTLNVFFFSFCSGCPMSFDWVVVVVMDHLMTNRIWDLDEVRYGGTENDQITNHCELHGN